MRLSSLGSINMAVMLAVISPVDRPVWAAQARKSDNSAGPTGKLRETVSLLRVAWGPDFESNYQKYMLGPSPVVVLIPRAEMIRIAAARLDGIRRDGATTQGLTLGKNPNAKIVVVYDDIAPLLVAQTIIHEIGHLQFMDMGLSLNDEEAHVRKNIDTGFFLKVLGQEWVEATVAALETKVRAIEKNGQFYQGYTTQAVETFYQQLRKAGVNIERNPLHDRIVANMVFILTNSEQKLSAALDGDDDVH